MIRSVLPLGGGGTNQNHRGSTSKLLELTDRDERQDGQEPSISASTQREEAEEEAIPPPAAIASVITQVTNDAGADTQTGRVSTYDEDSRSTWRSRIRAIFCCLAPGSKVQYARQDEGPVVIRPKITPPPPNWTDAMLGPVVPQDQGKKTLILDLDETLVHSSFRPVPSPDYVIPVEIEGRIVDVYVLKRPYVDHFLRAVGQRYEVVVFTASLGKYADPLLDLLDRSKVVRWRLFREACYPFEGSYVKDLQCLGRDLSNVIIVDNSPHSYIFQPENALPIGTFIDDPADQELLDCLDVLLEVEGATDVRDGLPASLDRLQNGMLTRGTFATGSSSPR